MSNKKKCKCGAEMVRHSARGYVIDMGNVTTGSIYCPVWNEQLSKAIEIGEEAYELLWEATRNMHTETELTGPRW